METPPSTTSAVPVTKLAPVTMATLSVSVFMGVLSLCV